MTADAAINQLSINPSDRHYSDGLLGNKIGRVTTTGVITEISIQQPDSRPFGICSGPDGALWFTEFFGNRIGRIATPVPAGIPTLASTSLVLLGLALAGVAGLLIRGTGPSAA